MSDDTPVFEFCALCGDSLHGPLDNDTGVCQDCMDAAPDAGPARETLPHEVYATDAPFVTLAMKTMTAQRMVGWLRDFADYCDSAENTKTATDARGVANRIAAEVEPESVRPADPGSESDEEAGDE